MTPAQRVAWVLINIYLTLVGLYNVCLLARVHHVSPLHVVRSLQWQAARRAAGTKTQAPDLPRRPF
jgi:hypothetical protein